MSDIIVNPNSELRQAEEVICQIQELLAKHDYGLMMQLDEHGEPIKAQQFWLVKCERHLRRFRRVAKVFRILPEGAIWREVDMPVTKKDVN